MVAVNAAAVNFALPMSILHEARGGTDQGWLDVALAVG